MKRLFSIFIIALSGSVMAADTIWLGGPSDAWAWRSYQAASSMEKTAEVLRFQPDETLGFKSATAIWDVPDTLADRVRLRVRFPDQPGSQENIEVIANCRFRGEQFDATPADLFEESEGWLVYEAQIPRAGMLDAIFFEFRNKNKEPFNAIIEIASAELLSDTP